MGSAVGVKEARVSPIDIIPTKKSTRVTFRLGERLIEGEDVSLESLVFNLYSENVASFLLFVFRLVEMKRLIEATKEVSPKYGRMLEDTILSEMEKMFEAYGDVEEKRHFLTLAYKIMNMDGANKKLSDATDSFNTALNITVNAIKSIKEEYDKDYKYVLEEIPPLPKLITDLISPDEIIVNQSLTLLIHNLKDLLGLGRFIVRAGEDRKTPMTLGKGASSHGAYEYHRDGSVRRVGTVIVVPPDVLIKEMKTVNISGELEMVGRQLGSLIRRLVVRKEEIRRNKIKGKIDFPRFMSFIATGSGKYANYRVRKVRTERPLGVGLLIDTSGSMGDYIGSKSLIQIASETAALLGMVLSMAKVPFLAAGFWEDDERRVVISMLKEDPFSYEPLPYLREGGNTPTGPAIRFFSRYMRLALPKNLFKLLFVITDGKPNSISSNVDAYTDVKMACKEAFANNMDVIGIMIGNKDWWDFETMFGPNRVVIKDPQELPIKLARILTNITLRIPVSEYDD